ncbi:LysR family transcriptional regulator [Tsukamurella sp. NPDC003166]|uniref:LysR family transcriptional regulator n=1 Tax=Tsukamurella sp. NPDC003166 TaxID=3154444 RepID=UPI0033BEE32C
MSESAAPVEAYLLRYFLAVVEHGGISAAAPALYLSQPALSQAIAKLESRVEADLFVRRPFELTEVGRRLVPAARSLLEQLDGAAAGAQRVLRLEGGRLDLVTYSAFTVDPLVHLVARFRRRYPDVRVVVHDVQSGQLARDAVRSGVAELGVVDGAEGRAATDLALPWQESVLVGLPSLLGALPDPVARETAAQLPLILDAAELPLLRAAGPAARNDEEAPNVVVDCSLPLATWRLVDAGLGVTIATRRVAAQRMRGAITRSLDPPLVRRPMVVRRSDRLSPAASAFVTLSGATRPKD